MRRVLPPANATFNAANGTITFATTIPASISHILRVTNLDRAVVYFDPTNPTNSGVLSGATYASPVLTLKANTSTHSNTDRLYIEYDDGQGLVDVQITGPVTVSNEVEIKNDSGSPIPVSSVDIAPKAPTTTSVPSSATSVTILASNASRRGVAINNQSTSRLYLSFSGTATVANSFIELGAGAFILLDQQLIVAGAITGIWSSANGTAQVTEFV